MESITLCPKCGADVEGLLERCDCCGAALVQNNDLFLWNCQTFSASGDVSDHLTVILERANAAVAGKEIEALPKIRFHVFCYPAYMYEEHKMSERTYFSAAKNSITITALVDFERYVSLGRDGRREIVSELVRCHLLRTVPKYKARIPELKAVILSAVHNIA